MQQVKQKLQEALAAYEKYEKDLAKNPSVEGAMAAARAAAMQTPTTQDMAILLAECLGVLEFATFNDGRYMQAATQRFKAPATDLVFRVASALGVKPYETLRSLTNGN